MKKILVIGSGISGLSAAISCAEAGARVILISPYVSERSQSVMAAGGINGALDNKGEGDSCKIHAEDTIKGGDYIADRQAVYNMCESAPDIIGWLERLGTVFSRDSDGKIDQRAFGGQSRKRTAYCGASTGKQIVTALTAQCRKLEAEGKVERRVYQYLLELTVADNVCAGAIIWDKVKNLVYEEKADAVILATGGQNRLFGKTTGSMLCDGSAEAQAFRQGAKLKNLEMIQYHPTTIETTQKRMLISEAARGEGGRLFYNDNGRRVYFMEDKYGKNGNLMPRDIVSREIYSVKEQVYLDITFLGEALIRNKLLEIYDLCKMYIDLDVTKQPIPVNPSVHFFMGGLDVDIRHETTIKNLFAVGECASIYHGANRLGGNSLLAACYSGRVAACNAVLCCAPSTPDSIDAMERCRTRIADITSPTSKFPCDYLMKHLAETMNSRLGIVRSRKSLLLGIDDVDFYLDCVKKIKFDPFSDKYRIYMAENQIILAKAILKSALMRTESRGAHYRSDYPKSSDDFKKSSIVSYDDGKLNVTFAAENESMKVD